jgi:hypothetical protein
VTVKSTVSPTAESFGLLALPAQLQVVALFFGHVALLFAARPH